MLGTLAQAVPRTVPGSWYQIKKKLVSICLLRLTHISLLKAESELIYHSQKSHFVLKLSNSCLGLKPDLQGQSVSYKLEQLSFFSEPTCASVSLRLFMSFSSL